MGDVRVEEVEVFELHGPPCRGLLICESRCTGDEDGSCIADEGNLGCFCQLLSFGVDKKRLSSRMVDMSDKLHHI